MSDELTQKLIEDEDKTTQPSITAVFQLIQSVKDIVQSGQTRQSEFELQVTARLNDLESQLKSGFSMLGDKIEALNRGRLQTEADYFSLRRRIEELESKTS